MDWVNFIFTVGSSALVIGILEWVRYRKKDRAEAALTSADADGKSTDNALRYAERLEARLTAVEEKLAEVETKANIFQVAINCAYRCEAIESPEKDCPVLMQLYDKRKQITDNGTER